jgi:hypothetical protein
MGNNGLLLVGKNHREQLHHDEENKHRDRAHGLTRLGSMMRDTIALTCSISSLTIALVETTFGRLAVLFSGRANAVSSCSLTADRRAVPLPTITTATKKEERFAARAMP